MSIPSLPIPTGGITHVFEAITILLAIEQIIGLRTIWTPKSLGKREVPISIIKKPYLFNPKNKMVREVLVLDLANSWPIL